jgi:hypothetical protein
MTTARRTYTAISDLELNELVNEHILGPVYSSAYSLDPSEYEAPKFIMETDYDDALNESGIDEHLAKWRDPKNTGYPYEMYHPYWHIMIALLIRDGYLPESNYLLEA